MKNCNVFFLIVGILCILFAFTHTWGGLKTSLSILNNSEIDSSTKIVFTYVWHIIGIENFIFGIALIIMSFKKNKENIKFTAWVIIAILTFRLIIISLFTLMNGESGIGELLIDSIAIIIVIALLIFGTRMKKQFNIL